MSFGPYRLVRPLGRSAVGTRWVALDERTGESRTVYRFPATGDHAERRRMLDALERIGSLDNPHLVTVDQYSLDHAEGVWAIAAYRGHQSGLVGIRELANAKGGQLSVTESLRAIDQLLSGISAAHDAGIAHGPVSPEEVFVDRHGSVWVELYGFARAVRGPATADEMVVRDEIRSIVSLGYTLLTGLDAEEPRMAPSRVVRKLDKWWDGWFDRGLEAAGGFESADEARHALLGDGTSIDDSPTVTTRPARGVLSRFRKPTASGR
ncbi:MAG: hypothetical protein DHS20C14_12890 [Phycisphaeraceae bacterium]|nr:MAG: hypothetical protein DHS20C14_12890 [Phycisphaeraceae bacterium]